MSDVFSAAISGMATNAVRATVAANNIANVNTPGFKASRATVAASSGQPEIHISESARPGAKLQTSDGLPEGAKLEETANVDLAEEFVQLQIAEYGYKANAAVIRTQDEILGTVLDILA